MKNKFKEISTGWLPKDSNEESKIASELIEYASKETTYLLTIFVETKGINPEDLNNLAQSEGVLPNAFTIATALTKYRQEETESVALLFWQDRDGKYWEELQLRDATTGEWFIKNIEQLPM